MWWETKRAALARQAETYERVLAVLREENSTFRRMLETSNARADQLALDLARSVVVQSTASAQPPAPVPPRQTSKDPIEGLGNVFAPVPYDHPDASFTNERAASLMLAEDEEPDGVSRAA